MTPLLVPASRVAGVAALALLVGGCSGGASVDRPAEPEPVAAVDATLIAVLADGADRLAVRVAADEHCEALEEADLLYTRSREGAEDGRVPAEVAREVEDVVTELSVDLTCEPEDDGPEDEPASDASSGSSGSTSSGSTSGSGSTSSSGGGNGNEGKGNGGGKGNSGGGKGNSGGGKGK